MTKKEQASVKRCTGRVEIMSRIQAIQEATQTSAELAAAQDQAELVAPLTRIFESIKELEVIVDTWREEYMELTGASK